MQNRFSGVKINVEYSKPRLPRFDGPPGLESAAHVSDDHAGAQHQPRGRAAASDPAGGEPGAQAARGFARPHADPAARRAVPADARRRGGLPDRDRYLRPHVAARQRTRRPRRRADRLGAPVVREPRRIARLRRVSRRVPPHLSARRLARRSDALRGYSLFFIAKNRDLRTRIMPNAGR
ncbi:transcriptional regulator, LysR family [Burkholderia pseudomallei MSHR449]|nr:transcriptional regulator, LysR family [Burkholderia pseudomallei MSHR449]